MKLRNILISAALISTFAANAQQINPVTKAMLDGYTEWLAQNPNDFETLYERASQYMQLQMLDNAYIDIVKAIENTPQKNPEMLTQEFSLLADILTAQGNDTKALEAIDKALQITPSDYRNIYKKGNILLNLKRPDDAYATFASLQRLKSRSQDAFFGMAKAKAMAGDLAEARDLIKEVEQANPSNFYTYQRIGDLFASLGQDREAADNYLIAFSLADSSSAPMSALIELGNKNYNAVKNSIDYALSKTKNTIPFDYLKATIAYRTGNFNDAYNSYTSLLTSPEGRDEMTYAGLARTCLALNKLNEAENAINASIGYGEESSSLILKSKILRALGNPAEALISARRAADMNPTSDALIEIALANIDLKNYDNAITALNEAIMNNADDPLPAMIRAYIYKDLKNDPTSATADYNRVGSIPFETFPEIAYAAMAKTFNGKKIDGDAMIETALTKDTGKNAAFWTAVYYAQTGNLDKARQYRQKAIDLGYSNLFNLDANKDANLNLSPLRTAK